MIPPILLLFHASGTVEKNTEKQLSLVSSAHLRWTTYREETKATGINSCKTMFCWPRRRYGEVMKNVSLKLYEFSAGHCFHQAYAFPSQSLVSLWASGATITPFTHLVLISSGKDRCLYKHHMKHTSFSFPALNLRRKAGIFCHSQLR